LSDPAGGTAPTYRILVRGFRAPVTVVGRSGPAEVSIDLTLTVTHPGAAHPEAGFPDDIAAVLSYDGFIADLRRLCAERPVSGPESLAEQAAVLCLTDAKVQAVAVEVLLPPAADGGAGSGASLERFQKKPL
jgi:dihydroneopterin aldolase